MTPLVLTRCGTEPRRSRCFCSCRSRRLTHARSWPGEQAGGLPCPRLPVQRRSSSLPSALKANCVRVEHRSGRRTGAGGDPTCSRLARNRGPIYTTPAPPAAARKSWTPACLSSACRSATMLGNERDSRRRAARRQRGRIRVPNRPGPVVHADVGVPSRTREDRWRREHGRLGVSEGPPIRRLVDARFQNHGWAVPAPTAQIQLASGANPDLAGEAALRRAPRGSASVFESDPAPDRSATPAIAAPTATATVTSRHAVPRWRIRRG